MKKKNLLQIENCHLVVLIVLFLKHESLGQDNLPPSFVAIPGTNPLKYYDMDKEVFDENLEVGPVIYTLIASDPENDPITFGITTGSDFFAISSQNDTHANVVLIQELDYETDTSHDITWTLDDGPNDIVYSNIAVYVTDINDNAPQFVGAPYIGYVDEDAEIGHTVLTVAAKDADSSNNGRFDFTMEDHEVFILETDTTDPTTAHLILNGTLDFESIRVYQVEIMVIDRGTYPSSLNSTADAFVNVNDVQDTSPYFLYLPYYDEVDENEVNATVMTVAALDGDRGIPNTVEFYILDNTQFRVETLGDTGEGVILTNEALDREEQSLITFTLWVRERDTSNQPIAAITSNTTVSVTVKDINDESPQFQASLYNGTIQENSPNSVAVDNLEMVIIDDDLGDGGTFSLSIIGDADSEAAFYVSPDEGKNRAYALIRVKNSTYLDYEERSRFDFQVLAEETVSVERRNSTVDVTVYLTDMNDHSPVFDQNPYESHIDEHAEDGTFVVQLNATDADSGTFGEVLYSLEGGSWEFFHVDPVDGNVTVTSQDLDRETSSTYFVIAAATDGGDRTTTTEIQVHLNDINDKAPEFVRDQYEGFIRETVNEEDIVTVEAADADEESTPNTNITYSILQVSPPEESFAVDSETGVVMVTTPLDFDTLPEVYGGKYTLTVMAEDHGVPPLNDTTTVIVNVEGVNDNTPYFLEDEYVAYISEEYTGGDYVITVHAYDDDAPHQPYQYDSTVDYRIISGSNDKFSLAPTTGIHNDSHSNVSISLGVANMDVDLYGYEYTMTLRISDRGNPQLYSDCHVIVHVNDVNNKPPAFEDKNVVETVREDVDVGHLVASMTATDPDRDSVLFYEITNILARNERGEDVTNGSDYTTQFQINDTTGSVYVNEPLDRETVETFFLDLKVTDTNATEEQSDTAELEVRVDDVNDENPKFQNTEIGKDNETEYYMGSIQEETLNFVYSEVKAVDGDKGANGDVDYVITEDETNHFQINRLTGDITLQSPVDREEHDQLNITVKAEDSGSPPLSSEIVVYFIIEDINDKSPVYENLPATTDVLENVEYGTEIYNVSASDDDSGNNAVIEYTITAGNAEGRFAINKTTGVVTIALELNREETAAYTLTITATDNPDGSTQLQTSSDLDIRVLDVNNNPPEFLEDSYEADVREDETSGKVVIRVTADDPDLDEGGDVSYRFGQRNDSGLFGITTDSSGQQYDVGVVTVAANSLTGQQGLYYLEIIASDGGTPPLNTSAPLMVNVLDVNDNPPVFDKVTHYSGTEIPVNGNTTIDVSLPENYTGPVCIVHASDVDLGINGEVTYSIKQNPADPLKTWERFSIDEITGEINITEVTDREVIPTYSLIIVASDQGDPNQLSSELNLQVVIEDEDDNNPEFPRDENEMPIPDILEPKEEQYYGDNSIGNVREADDKDTEENSKNYYFIIAGNEEGIFELDKDTREIFTNKSLDREIIPQYELTVKADPNPDYDPNTYEFIPDLGIGDADYWIDTTLQLVIIDVEDINDNRPVFKKTLYTAGVSTDTEYGASVTTVEATDADEGNNAVVRYAMIALVCSLDGDKNPTSCSSSNPADWPFIFKDPYDGIVYTNVIFEPGWTGYFDLIANASDIDDQGDETDISIYLLRDDQRVKVITMDVTENVVLWVDDFMEEISNITNAECNDDSIKVHVDQDGVPNDQWSDIFMHCIDPATNEIMDVDEIISLLDSYEENLSELYSEYSVIAVVPAVSESTATDLSQYLQISMGILLFVLLILLILLLYCYFTMRSRYKRKLRAASSAVMGNQGGPQLTENTMNLPGTNQHAFEGSNPLWNVNAPIYSEIDEPEPDKNSLDENAVEAEESEDQELTIDFNDDYDYFSKLPPEYAESDDILSAAIGEHDKQKFGLDLGEMEVTAV